MLATRRVFDEDEAAVNRASLGLVDGGGVPVGADLFSQTFDRYLAKSTLLRIRLHDLRHTHASILLKAGVPVTSAASASATAARRSR